MMIFTKQKQVIKKGGGLKINKQKISYLSRQETSYLRIYNNKYLIQRAYYWLIPVLIKIKRNDSN